MSEATSTRQRGVVERGTPRWFGYLLLAVPSFSTPMLLWAENYVGVGHPERLVLIGGTAWVASALALLVVRMLGASAGVSLVGVWVSTYLFMRGGAVVDRFGYLLGITLGVAVISVVLVLLSRSPDRRYEVILTLAGVLLVVEVMLAWYASHSTLGDDHSLPAPPGLEATLETRPDIVLIVADAFVGLDGLDRYFGVSDPAWRDELLSRGFQVPDLAYSPYVATTTAMTAMLDMAYPIGAGPGLNKTTTQALYDRLGGANQTVQLLSDNGYHITMLESGWSGSICGDEIDTCVESPFLDESTFFALSKTWLGPWALSQFGYPFTLGALHTMAWMEQNLPVITRDSRPDFVIAHLEIPHPPFFLDSDCNLDTSPERTGTTLQWPGVDTELRKAAYLDQAACFETFIQRLTADIDEDVVFVITGDHGSDSHNQLPMHPDTWSEDATRERLNVKFALRGPEGCVVEEPVHLVNVFRDLFSCMSEANLPPLEPRMFRHAAVPFDGEPSPVVELSDREVERLLDE